ncbi:MAG: hypothetical protein HC845_04980 [Akkermansiaceae bacterium]|nr:hypothetical protein [Akkermansiaceae bacterium]
MIGTGSKLDPGLVFGGHFTGAWCGELGPLCRSAYYAENEEERKEEAGKAELLLAKNRNGGEGGI